MEISLSEGMPRPDAEILALSSLWDADSITALARLWEMAYSLPALRLVATFFDRPEGPCPSISEIRNMSRKDLSRYVASLGMMFMDPSYANGLVEVLLEHRAAVAISTGPLERPEANLASYQGAFINAVMRPSDTEFERAFDRSFRPVIHLSAPEVHLSDLSAASNPGGFLHSYRASLVTAPPPKKQKLTPQSEHVREAIQPRTSPDISGVARQHLGTQFPSGVSPLSGVAWSANTSPVFGVGVQSKPAEIPSSLAFRPQIVEGISVSPPIASPVSPPVLFTFDESVPTSSSSFRSSVTTSRLH
jgi:hypothetical protein